MGFIPQQDQGNLIIAITLPPGASLARTEQVTTKVLNLVLGSPSALQLHGQANLTSPNIASNAQLPHVGGPPPQVGVGFLVAAGW